MTKAIFYFLLTLLIVPIIESCSKNSNNNSCHSTAIAPVTKIEGQNSGLVNQEILLTVSFGCTNGCGYFGNFEQTLNKDTTSIKVNANYDGCICTQVATILQTQYKFKAAQSGTYYLKFYQTENNYLIDTLKIQ